MFHDILFFLIGLLLIIAGGDYLTDGAEAVARKFKVSELMIGLTVVAFGSSTPDLVVSLMSTLQGKASLAVGDVIGANIFDILLSVGVMAVIYPFTLSGSMRQGLLPLLLLSSLALFFTGDDSFINGDSQNIITRADGLLLLGFFAVFLKYTISVSGSGSDDVSSSTIKTSLPVTPKPAMRTIHALAATGPSSRTSKLKKILDAIRPHDNVNMWIAALYIIGGLAALVIGGNWIVSGASGIARRAGLPESLVGLTIVAIGSSLPDLATSAIAAMKRQTGIAMGNAVGACIINVFMIIGLCAACRPMDINRFSIVDYLTLIAASTLLLFFPRINRNNTITRTDGIILCLLYVAYIVYLILFQR